MFWLLQGQWDRSAQEFEGPAPGGGALGVLEPANVAVLFEMRKPAPNGEVIAKLMKRFIYTAGILGLMQVTMLVIMTRVSTQ